MNELNPTPVLVPAACELVGPGGCRGSGWDGAPKNWPKSVAVTGEGADGGCCKRCLETKGCTAFHVTAADKKRKGKGECLLFGHASITAVERLGGKCYRVNRVPDAAASSKKSRGLLQLTRLVVLVDRVHIKGCETLSTT